MYRGTWWAIYSPWGHKETQLVTRSFPLMVIISRREPLNMPSCGPLSLSPGHCQVAGQQTADFPWLSSSWLCSLSLAPDPVAGMRHRMGSLSSTAHGSMGAPQGGSREPLVSFIFKRLRWKSYNVCVRAQSRLTLCDPMMCSAPGSSIHGISQARILEWDAISLLLGIFLAQGSNPCLWHLLHWQVDSLPLCHLGRLHISYN